MKKLLVGMLMASVASTAMAAAPKAKEKLDWYAVSMTTIDSKKPMCLMMNMLDKDRTIYVKFVQGWQKLGISVSRESWTFKEGIEVNAQIVVGDDRAQELIGTTFKLANKITAAVAFSVGVNATGYFMEKFSTADKLTIAFVNGNEPVWSTEMKGSKDAALKFAACVKAAGGLAPEPTEPFGDKKEQTVPFTSSDRGA